VCDDFSGYKACFELGVTEAGCMAHARRKFHELWANHGSQVGEQALKFFGQLYEVERGGRSDAEHGEIEARSAARPLADALHQWLRQQRSGARRLGHRQGHRLQPQALGGADALRRRRRLPIDNNWVENRSGRSRWGATTGCSPAACARASAAAVMSLVHSARLNGHDPTPTCATCWSCPRSRPAASPSCCRTAGSRQPPQLEQPRCICTGGHLTEPYEQNTQQSPALGRSTVLQCSHS
jgi:hypothetical protein